MPAASLTVLWKVYFVNAFFFLIKGFFFSHFGEQIILNALFIYHFQ